MDTANLLDLDAESATWFFDSAPSYFSNQPSPLLLSPSIPQPNLSQPGFSPLLQSPVWIFDERPSVFTGNCDPEKRDNELQNEKIRSLPMLGIDEIFFSSRVIKERLMLALQYFKEWTDQCVLVQVWVPVKNGHRHVLTTSEQPFVLDSHSNELLQYRTVSSMYLFSADESSEGDLGLPGRVFKQKLPEWTPNVQYYSPKEYPRLTHALLYNLRGSLALPVFEPSQQSCVGVVELVMTSQKVNYSPEVEKVCRALEAVNLKSCETLEHRSIQTNNESRRAELAEILKIQTLVCETHNLPLAQTWVPCHHGSVPSEHDGYRNTCSTSDPSGNGPVCMSPTDAAFYVLDAQKRGFRDACSEHHLRKGQGVAGRAFSARRPCFCSDITKFWKTEYPLVHYARMFGLGSCLALFIQSSHSEDDVYVAEFFLPSGCKDPIKQHALLESISILVWQNFRSLKVITGTAEVERWPLGMIDIITLTDNEMEPIPYSLPEPNTLENDSPEFSICTNNAPEKKQNKAEKKISLEVLQQYFTGSLKDAAKELGICPTTMKRICRKHGISRWPSRKIGKVNRSLSMLKQVVESVQGAQLELNLNSLERPLPDSVGSAPLFASLDADSLAKDRFASPVRCHTSSSPKPKHSSDGTEETPASRRSCHSGHPSNANNSSEDQNMDLLFPMTDNKTTEPNADMLSEDSTRSMSARNPLSAPFPGPKTVIIKASYKEDIIRFRLANDASIATLKEEVGKRLMLGISTFDIKYLDDSHDWVKLVCDEDLEWCFEISATSGASPPVIRLSVHDIAPKQGSSCSCKSFDKGRLVQGSQIQGETKENSKFSL